MSLEGQPFLNVKNLSCSQKLCKNQNCGDSFFIFSFLLSLRFLFFSFLAIDSVLEKRLQFSTFSAQMASIKVGTH